MRTRLPLTVIGLSLAALSAPERGAADNSGGSSAVFVSDVVVPHVLDVDLSRLNPSPPWQPGDPIEVVPEGVHFDVGSEGSPSWVDPVRQGPTEGSAFSGTLVTTFEAIPFTGSLPPDVVGDVGPDHYIAMANASRFAIFDKSGANLVPVTDLSDLWDGGSSPCTDGDGDPIVRHDGLADRWFMTEFDLSGNTFCWYVSQGPNPVTDGWFVYDFSSTSFPDYPQYGVWPDAYYVGTFETPSLGIYAFDRVSMLAGSPATFQRFTIPQLNGSSSRVTRILPADVDGASPPPERRNIFARSVDATQDSSDPTDRIELWEFSVDFAVPSNSTFTQMGSLFPEPFTLLPCAPSVRDCVPQPGVSGLLDALFNRALRRLQYRNFGTHESMVVTQVVDVGAGLAGTPTASSASWARSP